MLSVGAGSSVLVGFLTWVLRSVVVGWAVVSLWDFFEHGKIENRRIYHGKSKFVAVFDGLCEMLIIRYWMRMTGFQERNYV